MRFQEEYAGCCRSLDGRGQPPEEVYQHELVESMGVHVVQMGSAFISIQLDQSLEQHCVHMNGRAAKLNS